MKEQIDKWKEKCRTFFKADILEESRERVETENLAMLYLESVAFFLFSLFLLIYTKTHSNDSFLNFTYGFYASVSIVELLFVHYVVRKKKKLLPVVIFFVYMILLCYLIQIGIWYHREIPATSFYIFMALAFCFLVKPVRLIVMQAATAMIFALLSWYYKTAYASEIDLLNALMMFLISSVLGCTMLHFRMMTLRKLEQREEALKVKLLYQNILDGAHMGVVAHDMKTGEIFYGNDEIRRIYGIEGKIEELGPDSRLYRERGKKHQDLDLDALRNGASNESMELHESGQVYQVKGKVIDWNGRDAYVEYLRDITDSRRLNEQLQLAYEELQGKYQEELLYREKEISDDMIASSRINLTQGYIEEMRVGTQDGYEKKYHYARDLVSRITAFTKELWLTEEQNHNLASATMLQRYLKGERSFYEEYMAELRDGRRVWLRTDAKLVQRPETAEIIAFCYSRDITKEKELANILEKIMSFEYDEIYTVDTISRKVSLVASGQYVLDDQMQEGSYEQELENLMARTCTESDRTRMKQELDLDFVLDWLTREPVYINEGIFISKNGKPRLKQLRFIHLNKTLKTLLFTIADIDDVVKAEKKKQEELELALQIAEEANTTKMKFLASMSHEIRTPMNVIIGLASIMRDEVNNKAQVLDCAGKIDSASRYLLALLNDVLDMSKLESGSVALQCQEINAQKFWDDVNTLAFAQAKPANIKYTCERGDQVFESYIGDPVRIQQIMVNLINNAIKFTPAGGKVKVVTEVAERKGNQVKVRVKVSDTGIGMSKEFLPKVFQVFAQEHEGNTSIYGGSGLGLSIARSYAQLMNGDITVESELGVGTTFTIELWLEVAKENKDAAETVPLVEKKVSACEGKRILLVEDHPLNTMVAAKLLNKRGMEVVYAGNGQEAVDVFCEKEEFYFDLILMDIRMPVMDGLEATRVIRNLKRKDAKTVPIIAMTANAYDEDRQKTKEAGMNAHLAKPIEPKQMYETIESFF